ncbi:hypothetical protein BKA65DRAFT_582667 [Rhexocercosporidium sp. MPI-PUGE-AT-0058]|nr:hypothetical protein BKA65DRAFT_582667 [Rhexocercosporidium sp. MPI-PUGE-AT-0058]
MLSIIHLCYLFLLAVPAFAFPVEERSELDLVKRATCPRDNLLRCFEPTAIAAAPTRAAATAFCSSYLSIPVVTSVISTQTSTTTIATVTDYATTTLPLVVQRAATANPIACTSTYSPAQLSSACSCLSITPSTTYTTATSTNTFISTATNTITATATPAARCTSNVNLIANPSFEAGSNSWYIATYGANTPPTFVGVIGGGLNSVSAYSVSSGPSGTGVILSQSISGLVPGVTYTFSYDYMFKNTGVASSIQCSLNAVGLSGQSTTNGNTPENTWTRGPTWGTTFTATGTGGDLLCFFVARGAIIWKVDNFYIGC